MIPPDQRADRFGLWAVPVMYPRMTYEDAIRQVSLKRIPVDHGPLLRVLKQPVSQRNQEFVVTWEEWNAEAERETRGYDAEIQHHPTMGDFVHVRSKPGMWAKRQAEFKRWMKQQSEAGGIKVSYRRKRRGSRAKATRRLKDITRARS